MPKLKVELKREHFNEHGHSYFDVLHEDHKKAWLHAGGTALGVVAVAGSAIITFTISPTLGIAGFAASGLGTGLNIGKLTSALGGMDIIGHEIRKRIHPPKGIKKKELNNLKQILTPEGLQKLHQSGINLEEPFYVVPKGTKTFSEQVVHVVQKQPRFSRLLDFLKRKKIIKQEKYVDERITPKGKRPWIEYAPE